MHRNINTVLLIGIVVLATVTSNAAQHCNDKIRGLVENSCRTMTMAYKQRQEMIEPYRTIVKRQSSEEPEYHIEFLENETAMESKKGHRLFEVRHISFPKGAHLILSHHNAKILKQYDPDYKIHPKKITYHSHNGVLVTNRHKRNSHLHKRETTGHRIAGCCDNDVACLLAMCVIRH